MRPKIVPIRYLQNKSYQGDYDPDTHVITTPVFRGSDTRIMYPFDMYRKSLISHETTHHLHNSMLQYSKLVPVNNDGGHYLVHNTIKPMDFKEKHGYYKPNSSLYDDDTEIMQRLIHKGNPYLQHDRNVANTPMSKELKD